MWPKRNPAPEVKGLLSKEDAANYLPSCELTAKDAAHAYKAVGRYLNTPEGAALEIPDETGAFLEVRISNRPEPVVFYFSLSDAVANIAKRRRREEERKIRASRNAQWAQARNSATVLFGHMVPYDMFGL